MKVNFLTHPAGGHVRTIIKDALLKLLAPIMGGGGEIKVSVHRESSRACGTKHKRPHTNKVVLVSRGPEHLGLCLQIGKKHRPICVTGGAAEVTAVANLFKRDGKWAPGTQQVINLLMPLTNDKGHIPAAEVARVISSVFNIRRNAAGPKILALKNAGILKALNGENGRVAAYELLEDGVVEGACAVPQKEAPAPTATNINEENELLGDIATLVELANRLPSLQEKAATLQRELEDLEKELKRAQAAQQQLDQIRSIIKSP